MRNWSEFFQSDVVREITSKMTSSESSKLKSLGAMAGKWVAFTFALPISFGVMFVYRYQWEPGYYIIGALVIIYFIGMRIIRRKTREMLCSTEYAKSKGYKPGDLRMFKFPWSK